MRNLFLSFFALSLFILGGCETEKVQMTDSGYQYVSCKDVAGEPGEPGDFIFIHAKLFAGDSLIFNSRDQGKPTPVQIPTAGEPRGQLSPLQDVIALMSIGDSMRFDYPLDSFEAQRPQLPAGVDFVTYDILVTDIMTPEMFETWRSNEMKLNEERLVDVEALMTQTYSDYLSGALEGKIKRTESGLGYIIHKQGTGAQPGPSQVVDAQYYGVLASDGSMFDNSFQRGQAFSFQVGMGMVIPGWDEGFQLLTAGTKATLFIPSSLGYGDRGSPPVIPADAELIFYVELEGVH